MKASRTKKNKNFFAPDNDFYSKINLFLKKNTHPEGQTFGMFCFHSIPKKC